MDSDTFGITFAKFDHRIVRVVSRLQQKLVVIETINMEAVQCLVTPSTPLAAILTCIGDRPGPGVKMHSLSSSHSLHRPARVVVYMNASSRQGI